MHQRGSFRVEWSFLRAVTSLRWTVIQHLVFTLRLFAVCFLLRYLELELEFLSVQGHLFENFQESGSGPHVNQQKCNNERIQDYSDSEGWTFRSTTERRRQVLPQSAQSGWQRAYLNQAHSYNDLGEPVGYLLEVAIRLKFRSFEAVEHRICGITERMGL